MFKEALQDLYHIIIKNIKKYSKPILVILIYFLYQGNFLISIGNLLGFNIRELDKTLRIFFLVLNDLIYIIALLLIFKNDIKSGIKDLKENFNKRLTISLNCWMIGCLIMATSSFIIGLILNKEVSGNEQLVRESIKLAPFYMLFSCSIVAPIFEEMVFRKALNMLIKPKWIFILVSGLGFGLLHILGSYTSILDFLYIIPYGAIGTAFAYLLTKTKNITLPIIIHMIHNTILVLAQIIRR